MSVPTGIGNYPPGVTDNDPHFDGDSDDVCLHCEKRQREPGSDYCGDCENELSEAAYERRMEDGECFRGGEAAAYEAEQQAWIQRNLK